MLSMRASYLKSIQQLPDITGAWMSAGQCFIQVLVKGQLTVSGRVVDVDFECDVLVISAATGQQHARGGGSNQMTD